MTHHSLTTAQIESINGRAPRRWRGYTLEELRTQRLVTQARIMVEKAHLDHIAEGFRRREEGRRSVLQKILGALDVIDYSVMGYTVIQRLSTLFGRRKR